MVVIIGRRNLILSFKNSISRNNGTKTVETSTVFISIKASKFSFISKNERIRRISIAGASCSAAA